MEAPSMASQPIDIVDVASDDRLALSRANAENSSLYSSSLTDTHIRLLSIIPDADTSAPVRCTLQQYVLSEDVSYEALSYVWGDLTSPRQPVLCNNQTAKVTPNLHQALVRLRLEQTPRLVWIDALCINQADTIEKSFQVPLMANIYSRASRAVIWLGEVRDEAFVSNTVRSIQEIYEYCMSILGMTEHRCNSWNTYFKILNIKLPAEIIARIRWQGFRTLFSNVWFERIWCYQEFQLARTTIVYWGSHELEAMKVAVASFHLTQLIASRAQTKHEDLNSIAPYSRAVTRFLEPSPINILLETINFGRHCKATDPRDMVYGLFGLINFPLSRTISIDYTKSTCAVFTDVAILCVEMWGLSVLGYVSHSRDFDGHSDFPSWVPQWHIDERNFSGRYLLKFVAGAERQLALTKLPTSQDPILRLEGLFYSSVSGISLEMGSSPNPDRYHEQIDYAFLEQWYQDQYCAGQAGTSSMLSMALTFTDAYVKNNPYKIYSVATEEEIDSFIEDFTAWLHHLKQNLPNLTINLGSLLAKKKVGDWKRFASLAGATCKARRFFRIEHDRYNFGPDKKIVGDWKRFASLAGSTCKARRFFRTEHGRYGFGPDCIRTGDVVAVMFGSNAPYVLRPKYNGFIFLGSVYVHELMGGQLVGEFSAGKMAKREFCII
jgi:hypothetical protein